MKRSHASGVSFVVAELSRVVGRATMGMEPPCPQHVPSGLDKG